MGNGKCHSLEGFFSHQKGRDDFSAFLFLENVLLKIRPTDNARSLF